MSPLVAALRAFKIVQLNHALPSTGEVPQMIAAILDGKRQGRLMGMNNGFDDYLIFLEERGFDVSASEVANA